MTTSQTQIQKSLLARSYCYLPAIHAHQLPWQFTMKEHYRKWTFLGLELSIQRSPVLIPLQPNCLLFDLSSDHQFPLRVLFTGFDQYHPIITWEACQSKTYWGLKATKTRLKSRVDHQKDNGKIRKLGYNPNTFSCLWNRGAKIGTCSSSGIRSVHLSPSPMTRYGKPACVAAQTAIWCPFGCSLHDVNDSPPPAPVSDWLMTFRVPFQ